ncbi:MAG: HD domain-containing phosphohydrolase [Neptuniibacter sp.]
MDKDYKNYTVMLVDDEADILCELKKLISHLGCNVITFDSPVTALEQLDHLSVDLVISDMRMPEMGGECFLEEVSKKSPDIERIVLTGLADLQATIDAINKGKISRYMQKPWHDEDVIKVVKKGFELKHLRQENERLLQEAKEKNIQLEQLNNALEEKVKERTEMLQVANQQLKGSYRSIVRMFSTLTARRLGIKASAENRKLNMLMITLAGKLELDNQERKQLYYAWQLRHIGKLSFQDYLINVPYTNLNPAQQRAYQQHPILANAACLMVKPLYPAGQIILQHKEYLDGSGYPQGLEAEKIKFRAQVLCVISDYLELIYGMYAERKYSTSEAMEYLREEAKERYNQDVVAVLSEVIEELSQEGATLSDSNLHSDQLRPKMVLSRDLISDDGIMLLSEGQELDKTSIDRIREMEFNLQESFQIYINQ